MKDKKYTSDILAESISPTFSDSVVKSGLLDQVMKLSRTDKAALIEYLEQDVNDARPFNVDSLGRIMLTKEMKSAVAAAESSLESGKCLSEDEFKQRFSRWL